MKQRQFLDTLDEATAHRRFDEACSHLAPNGQVVPLSEARGRVLFASHASQQLLL